MNPGLNTSTSSSGSLWRRAVGASPASVVRQLIADLEEPGFVYLPMFGGEVRSKVTELLRLVSQAQGTLEMQRASEGAEMKSWWGWLTGVLSGTEEEGADARKSLLHLRSASSDLCQLFKLQPVAAWKHASSGSFPGSFLKGDVADSSCRDGNSSSSCSTFLGSSLQQKHYDIGYQGNPDLEPIRNYEVTFLVRTLHALSTFLNDKYGLEMASTYQGDSIRGRIFRQLLYPPTSFVKVTKMGTDKPPARELVHLPPRVCLRLLAHKQFLGYLGFLLLLAHFLGYSVPLVFLGMLLLFAAFVLTRAVVFRDLRSIPSLSFPLASRLHR